MKNLIKRAKDSAEEEYSLTPLSVLAYIRILEDALIEKPTPIKTREAFVSKWVSAFLASSILTLLIVLMLSTFFNLIKS